MGSLASRPKAVVAAASAASPVTATTSPSTSTTSTNDVTTTEADPVEVAKTRVENVLRRSRSLLGTVMTSLRGSLDAKEAQVRRKSLLGE